MKQYTGASSTAAWTGRWTPTGTVIRVEGWKDWLWLLKYHFLSQGGLKQWKRLNCYISHHNTIVWHHSPLFLVRGWGLILQIFSRQKRGSNSKLILRQCSLSFHWRMVSRVKQEVHALKLSLLKEGITFKIIIFSRDMLGPGIVGILLMVQKSG